MEPLKFTKEIKEEKLNEVKAGAEEYYSTIGDVHCPYFKERVNFNAKGLDHIKFKDWNRARNRSDQYMRLKLLHCATEVISKSNTLQGISKIKSLQRVKTNSRWEEKLKEVTYYMFFAVVGKVRIKVIVKEIEGGQKYFWSIIPYWHIKAGPGKRLIEGNPETD